MVCLLVLNIMRIKFIDFLFDRLFCLFVGQSRLRGKFAAFLLSLLMLLLQPACVILFTFTHVLSTLANLFRRFMTSRSILADTDDRVTDGRDSFYARNIADRVAFLWECCALDLSTSGKTIRYPKLLMLNTAKLELAKAGHKYKTQSSSPINFAKHRYVLESMLMNYVAFLAIPLLWFIRRLGRLESRLLFISCEGRVVAPTRVRCYHFSEQINHALPLVSSEVKTFYDQYLHNQGFLINTDRFPAGRLIFLMLKEILKSQYGVIVHQRPNYDFPVSLICKLLLGARIKLVLDIDDFTFSERVHLICFKLFHVRACIDILAPWADEFVVSSQYLFDYVRKRYPYHKPILLPTYPGRQFVIQTSVPPTPKKSTTLIYSWVGTLFQPENLADVIFIIQAWLMANIVDAELHIVGGGFFHTLLQLALGEDAKKAGIHIKDWISPDQMPSYLVDIDVGIYCLTNDNDFMRSKSPTKLFEYWAYSKAVVSTSIGEAVHFMEDGKNGLVADSLEQMAQAFQHLATDKELRLNLGREGRRQVLEKWNQEAVSRCYAEIISVIPGDK